MAVQYLIVCLFDFIIAPVLSWVFAYYANVPYLPWEPLTLKGGSMYHLSMGAVVGVTSWAKTKEKIEAVDK